MVTESISLNRTTSPSGQLSFYIDNAAGVLHCSFKNIKLAGVDEFLNFVAAMGDAMQKQQIGRMCMDITELIHFDIPTRMAVVKNLDRIFLSRIPFLVLAVVKGKSVFENMTMQLAIAATKPLSKKFRDSQMFDETSVAVDWLKRVTL